MSKELLTELQHRLKKYDQNWISAVTGPTGSGKSSSALSLAETLDPNFSVDNIVFSAKEFLTLLETGNLPSGAAIVWEEIGVGLNAREFMKTVNKVVSYIFQTMRYRNIAVIVTVPYMAYIDKSARILFHAIIETVAIYRKERLCITKWFNIQYNQKKDKVYSKYPVVLRDGKRVRLTRIKFSHASKELWNAYLKKKREFNKQLQKRVLNDVIKYEQKQAPKEEINEDEICATVHKNPDKFKTRIGTINAAKLRSRWNISVRKAQKLKAKLEDELGL